MGPPTGRYWTISKGKFSAFDHDKRIWWGQKGDSIPQLKRFLSEVKQGVVPQTMWAYQEVGHTQEAKQELVAICDFEDSASVFITPKPVRLLKRILEIATDKDSLILDSFAGSGTTGHAVLDLNKADGGNRRFILVEMDENICQNVTAQRLSRAIRGYSTSKDGGKTIEVSGLGGGFRYCTLGDPLFDEGGNISEAVTFADLAAHVFFTETGTPLRQAIGETPLLGAYEGKAVYLLFNGVLGDKRLDGGNVLTNEVLKHLPLHDGPKVIYGEGCRVGANRLRREGIVFKQVPYEIQLS